MKNKHSKYLYGPVPSRRLGFSLGIDLTPYKTCSFDCIYCQLGKTTKKTILRREYLPICEIIKELKAKIKSRYQIDYITFSGSGEPTLNSKIGQMINEIKRMTGIPVAVITNSSLLSIKKVRKDLARADLAVPSLDAGIEKTFRAINRPYSTINFDRVINGLLEFRSIYRGKIYLEIMFVKGLNDSDSEVNSMYKLVKKIDPDLIQLNTVYRPTSELSVLPTGRKRLNEIRKIFGPKCEIILPFRKERRRAKDRNIEELISNILRRRPATANDIVKITGLNPNVVVKYLNNLVRREKIKLVRHRHTNYYELY